MHFLQTILLLPFLTAALLIPSNIERDYIASEQHDAFLASREEAVAPLTPSRNPLWSTFEKRRGGGGGGGRGGGSSSGGSSSSSGGRGGSSGSSSSSSGSSGGSSGGRGSTSAPPSFGGGRTYAGGSTTSYPPGGRSPTGGISPTLLGAGALGFGGGLLLFGGLGAYVRDISGSTVCGISNRNEELSIFAPILLFGSADAPKSEPARGLFMRTVQSLRV